MHKDILLKDLKMSIYSNHIAEFFTQMAAALEQRDRTKIATLFKLPCIVITDEQKRVLHSADDIINVYGQRFEQLSLAGVSRIHAEILNQVKLSDAMVYCRINWLLYPPGADVALRCPCSYILQAEKTTAKQQRIKIMVSVVEEKQLLVNMVQRAS